MFVGQERIKYNISKFTLDTLPHSMLIIGAEGCGKHTLVSYIADKFNLPVNDITEDLSFETITKASLDVFPSIYLIDLSKLQIKKENILLKFVEEPNISNYIILLSSSESQILPTISNRCYKMYFDSYSKEELSEIIEDKNILPLLNGINITPGQLKHITVKQFVAIENISIYMLSNIDTMLLPDFLAIKDKINYDDEYDKFNLMLFISVLKKNILNLYRSSNDNVYVKLYNLISKYNSYWENSKFNKKVTMSNLLLNMWKLGQDETK